MNESDRTARIKTLAEQNRYIFYEETRSNVDWLIGELATTDAELTRLRADLDEAVRVLKPLAEEATAWPPDMTDAHSISIGPDAITLGQCRRAREIWERHNARTKAE